MAHYVWNKADFDAVDPETTDYLMGELAWGGSGIPREEPPASAIFQHGNGHHGSSDL